MMSSATADLASSVCLLEFVTKALEFIWFDKLIGHGLIATEYCSSFCNLDVDGEFFESVSTRSGIDK